MKKEFLLWQEEVFVLSVVMSLRYYQGHLGVVHYVTHIKWKEIAAISVAVWWLGGGEEWCTDHYIDYNSRIKAEVCKSVTFSCVICFAVRIRTAFHRNGLFHWFLHNDAEDPSSSSNQHTQQHACKVWWLSCTGVSLPSWQAPLSGCWHINNAEANVLITHTRGKLLWL